MALPIFLVGTAISPDHQYNCVSSRDALKALEIDLSGSRQLGRLATRFFTEMRSLHPLALSILYAT